MDKVMMVLLVAILASGAEVLAGTDRINPCFDYGKGLLSVSTNDAHKVFVSTPEQCVGVCRVKGCPAWQFEANYNGATKGNWLGLCSLAKSIQNLKKIESPNHIAGYSNCKEKNYMEDACFLRNYRRETNWPIKDRKGSNFTFPHGADGVGMCMEKCVEKIKKGCKFYTFDSGTGSCDLLRAGKLVEAVGHFTGKSHCDQCQDAGYNFARNNLAGRRVVISFAACRKHCVKIKYCIGIVYQPYKHPGGKAIGQCFPKHENARKTPHATFVSSLEYCERDLLNTCFDFGVFYTGVQLGKFVVLSAHHCRLRCQRDHRCGYFNYQDLDYSGKVEKGGPPEFKKGNCWLLKSTDKQITKDEEEFAGKFTAGEKFCGRLGMFEENKSTYTGFKFVPYAGAVPKTTKAGSVAACQHECNQFSGCSYFNFRDKDLPDKMCEMLSEAKLVVAAGVGYTVGWSAFTFEPEKKLVPMCDLTWGMYHSMGFKVFKNLGPYSCWAKCSASNICGSINYDTASGSCALLSDRFAPKSDAKFIFSGTKCG